MRRLSLLLAVFVTIFGCSGTKGNVVGQVKVAAGHPDMGVWVVLWQVPAALSEPSDPSSPLIPAVRKSELLSKATLMGQVAAGITDAEEGTFKYTIHSLDRGLYFVGAYLSSNEDPTQSILSTVHFIGSDDLIEVDPAVTDRSTASRDLYLGMSAPDRGTLSGVVHMSDRTATGSASIVAFDGNPFIDANASIVAQQDVNGQTDAPFTIFNVPLSKDGTPQKLFVTALADANGDKGLSFYGDFVSMLRENPLYLTQNDRVADGLELWLDRQAPDRGSISGLVNLSAGVDSAELTILAFSSDPMRDAQPNVVGVMNTAVRNVETVPVSMPSMPLGSIYLIALMETAGVYEGSIVGQYEYGRGATGMTPVVLTPDAPHVTDFAFPMGVGRISGLIDTTGAPSNVTAAMVFATKPGSNEVVRIESVTFAAGQTRYAYELFGFADGQYDLYLEANTGLTLEGSPKRVQISGGNREGSDFSFAN